MRRLPRLLFLTLPLAAGCHCGDRPGLFERLFKRDDDCPSSRAAARAPGPCEAQCVPNGSPVSYTAGPVVGGPVTVLPGDAGTYAPPRAATPADELPQPGSRLPAQRDVLPGGR